MFVSIKNIDKTIQVKTQFNPDFACAARKIGGKYDYSLKAWCFDERNIDLVKAALLDIFGTDGYNQSVVDVEITVKKKILGEQSPIYLGGRIIAQARGRDSGATIGDGVVFIEKSPTSGGSVKNWSTKVEEGLKFKILDLYEGALKFLDNDESIEYKIISKKSPHDELQQLKAELARITSRIAELEA
ncbi:hypothetical protein [Gilliamella sp. ESL0250]|uniref:hypothetical protein n=1 Tax=Gilliamella sp. ESL0250 TaxID=2705036 RepID=UPI0015806C71|nr:hypothetical protein [Gilliamella sp. ESL0250]NUF49542.1 hypothetical protein [Gilliamella sp. ESL0250]